MDTKYTEEEFKAVEAELEEMLQKSLIPINTMQDLFTVMKIDLIDFWPKHKIRLTEEQEKKVRVIARRICRRHDLASNIVSLVHFLRDV